MDTEYFWVVFNSGGEYMNGGTFHSSENRDFIIDNVKHKAREQKDTVILTAVTVNGSECILRYTKE